MLYDIEIKGIRPLIMHSGAGINPRHPAKIQISEITRKQGSNRTASDDAQLIDLECGLSLWLDENETPTIPPTALRSAIEKGARKRKQGNDVKEGLIVYQVSEFIYDRQRYGDDLNQIVKNAAFTTGVVVRGNRIQRTRARFDMPWSCKFVLECYDDLVDEDKLGDWLGIAGHRIGLGDWRPEKSGDYGRFEVVEIKPRAS